jgi:hypothetical protein
MRQEVLLLVQLLLTSFCYCQHTGDTCHSNSDCDSWLTCINNECTACLRQDVRCDPHTSGFDSQCCEGTTCENIPGLNGSQCRPHENICSNDAQCSGGLKCLQRIGKCGLCHSNGEHCSLPYDDLECCSSYCNISTNGSGVCTNLRHWNRLYDNLSLIRTTLPPRPCINFLALCETDSDCCQSNYHAIICATANHRVHIIGYHMYNKKHCTMAHL